MKLTLLLTVLMLLAGCGHDKAKGADGGHGESPSGASFKAGKGITLTDETRKILGVEIAEVMVEPISQVIRFNVQIYGDAHRFVNVELDHTGCDVHGSGFVAPDKAALVAPKQPINLLTADNQQMEGFVVAVQNTPSLGETEVVVGVVNSGTKLKDGEFVTATIALPREEAVVVIPKTALLRTAGGTFVYALNGSAYYKTAVKTGGETDDKIEIIDGLFAGDQVVTKPVETLWLIELRATKGGGHCH